MHAFWAYVNTWGMFPPKYVITSSSWQASSTWLFMTDKVSIVKSVRHQKKWSSLTLSRSVFRFFFLSVYYCGDVSWFCAVLFPQVWDHSNEVINNKGTMPNFYYSGNKQEKSLRILKCGYPVFVWKTETASGKKIMQFFMFWMSLSQGLKIWQGYIYSLKNWF